MVTPHLQAPDRWKSGVSRQWPVRSCGRDHNYVSGWLRQFLEVDADRQGVDQHAMHPEVRSVEVSARSRRRSNEMAAFCPVADDQPASGAGFRHGASS